MITTLANTLLVSVAYLFKEKLRIMSSKALYKGEIFDILEHSFLTIKLLPNKKANRKVSLVSLKLSTLDYYQIQKASQL